MAGNSSESQSLSQVQEKHYYGCLDRLKLPALCLFILLVALAVLFYILNITASFDSRVLTLILNFVFVVIPSFFITYMATRGFIRTGVWYVLWMGVGTLAFGLAVLLSMTLRIVSDNSAATTYSILVLFSGLLFILGTFFSLNSIRPQEHASARLLTLLQVYTTIFVFIIFITLVSIQDLLPGFFVSGSGGTSLRLIVQAIATFFFLLAGLTLFRQSFSAESSFLRWFSLALLLMCLSMGGNLLITTVGTPLNWILRSSQLFGGLYLYAAAMIIIQEAKVKQISAGDSLASLLAVTEVKLKEATERFRMVFEYAETGIALGGLDGKIIESNTALEHMLEYTKEELRNKHFSEFTHPEDTTIELLLVKDVIAGKRSSYKIDKRFVTKEGKTIWVHLVGSLVRGHNEEPLMSIALIEDITERKKTEKELMDSRSLIQSFFDSPGVMRGIVEIIDDVTVCHIMDNSVTAGFMGLPLEALKGKLSSELGEPPEIIRIWVNHYRESELKRKPVAFDYLDFRGKHKAWLSVMVNYLGISPGGQKRFGYVVYDITDRKLTEDNLRETSDYLNNLLDYANAPIIVWEPQYRITRFNHAFERLTGRTSDEVIGRELGILFPENRKDECMGYVKRASSGERLEIVEIPILNKDGFVFTVLWNSATLYDKDGKTIVATMAQGQDITERKLTEDNLRETSDYLNNLLDYANAPIIVWDPQYRITRFNHAFERLTGRTSDEVIGRELGILFPENRKDECMGYVKRASSGERLEIVEIPILNKDGFVFTVLWNSATLYDKDGKTIVATMAQGQDITERKRTEEILHQTNERLELAYEAAGAGTWDWDVITGHIKWSPRMFELFGLDQHKIVASFETWEKVMHPADRIQAASRIDRALKEHAILNSEYRVILPDGKIRWISSIGKGMYDDYARAVRMIGICSDITERKETDQLKEEFIGMVSHELRTPLTVIIGSLDAAMTEGISPEDKEDMLKESAKYAETLAGILENLLELSRFQAGRLKLQKVDIDIEEIAQEIVSRLKTRSISNNFKINIPNDSCMVFADHTRVELILRNLVDNAVKYSPQGGDIEIFCKRDDKYLSVGVRDYGIGISSNDQKKLFQQFGRVGDPASMKGIGLGLVVCQRLVETHGGRIWLESEPNKGSTFYFTLPNR